MSENTGVLPIPPGTAAETEIRESGIFKALATVTGDEFFSILVRHLATATGADLALVATLDSVSHADAETIVAFAGGEAIENFEFDLGEAVRDRLTENGPEPVLSALRGRLIPGRPENESFVAVPLQNALGELAGMMALFGIGVHPEAGALLQSLAPRAGSELERRGRQGETGALAREALRTLVQSMVGHNGQACLDKVAEELCRWFGADCAMVGEIVAGSYIKVLSMRMDGEKSPESSYPLAGTPCESVVKEGFRIYPLGVGGLFPADEKFSEFTAEGYIGAPVRDREGQVIGVLSVIFRRRISRPELAEEVLSILAEKVGAEIEHRLASTMLAMNDVYVDYLGMNDALTGLPNRIQFRDRLQMAVGRANRSGSQLALLLLDLDRFKNINDSLGHETGDQLICEVASRLLECVGDAGMVAKFWGDEFTILLDQIEDLREVVSITRQIHNAFSRAFTVTTPPLHITTSIGISLFPADATDAQKLIDCADAALSCAKEEGKNDHRFFSAEMNYRARKLLVLENYLREALEQEQLTVRYQPQVELDSGKLIATEALLRWKHPEQSMISPADFIPLAEETGLIIPIGEWVLKTACAQNKAWQDAGYPPVPVSVNISAHQFRDPGLVKIIPGILAETGLDPRYLELEITEGVVLGDVESAITTMEALSGHGVRLSIDDFGTGYSSLNYLKRFPIHKLKIDRSFIGETTTNKDAALITTAIVALARSMNLEVIAEGVETREQVEFLLAKGCLQGQGYLFAQPLVPEELPPFLSGN